MNALLEKPDTLVPSEADTKLAKRAARELAGRGEGELRIRLDKGDEITLPRSATRLIVQLLTEMSRGNAVTLIPVDAELTTQEAADILGVSRPHLIKLLEGGSIPFHLVGTHRRIKFRDLEQFRAKFEADRQRTMQDLADQAQDLEMGY